MGYYIEITNSSFRIPKANLDKFWELATHLMTDEIIGENGTGGSWVSGKKADVWYAWVDTEKARKAILNRDIVDFFAQWGYDVLLGDNDSQYEVVDVRHSSHSSYKIGNEEVLFAVVAPTIEPESFLHVKGENGEEWRWTFSDGNLHAQDVVDVVYHFAPCAEYNRITYGTPKTKTLA